MLVVGELINGTRKPIAAAIEELNAEYIQEIAKKQWAAGANYIDVNAGAFVGQEADHIEWLVKTVQAVVEVPCCLDSADPMVIERGLSVHKGNAMINSISLEAKRYQALMPILAGTDLKIVALCMGDDGMPETTEERIKIADKLINGLVKNNVPLDNIYVDPLVQPISTKQTFGIEFLNAIEQIMTQYKGVHTICGLSNISFGLPIRKYLNQMCAVMAIAKGLDSLIINPLDKQMMANLIAAEMIAGRDYYCLKYLNAYQKKEFEFLIN